VSDLELTKEERGYVMRVAHSEYSARSNWGFHAAFILPMLAFSLYGLICGDFVAEFIAFSGLLLFLLWRISRENERLVVRNSLFRKIADHERNHGA
jgi:hypothetical protein